MARIIGALEQIPLAVLVYVLARAWDIIYNLAIIAVIIWFFSPIAQGYHFTFLNLTIISTVLEGGFGFVMLQFLSHEWSRLRLVGRRPEGDPMAVAALLGLVRFAVRWHLGLAVPIVALLYLAGWTTFAGASGGVDWHRPWTLLCLACALQVFGRGLLYIIEAADRLVLAQTITMASNIAAAALVAVHVALGPNLYLACISVGVRAVIQAAAAGWYLLPILRADPEDAPLRIDWRRNILPQQWRIMLSSLSGFLMFQSMTVIAFKLAGPEIAGQIGLSMSIYRTLNFVAMAWLYNVQPRVGRLAALGDRAGLVRLFRRTVAQSVVSAAGLGALTLIAFSFLTGLLPHLGDRMVGPGCLSVLFVVLALQQITNVQTAFVRMHKVEPFLRCSLACAALVVLASTLGALTATAEAIVLGFSAVTALVNLPWTHLIFQAFRLGGGAFASSADSNGYKA